MLHTAKINKINVKIRGFRLNLRRIRVRSDRIIKWGMLGKKRSKFDKNIVSGGLKKIKLLREKVLKYWKFKRNWKNSEFKILESEHEFNKRNNRKLIK